MINVNEMRELQETSRRMREKAARAEAARWLRSYEADMKAACEEGEFLLPRHDKTEVNVNVYHALVALGYECEYKNDGILVKW